jgi:hypothetical protein
MRRTSLRVAGEPDALDPIGQIDARIATERPAVGRRAAVEPD